MDVSVVASPIAAQTKVKEGTQGVQRLIEVLEEYFVYASTGKEVVDINVAAGIALAELRRVKGLYEENGQEAGSPPRPEIKPI